MSSPSWSAHNNGSQQSTVTVVGGAGLLQTLVVVENGDQTSFGTNEGDRSSIVKVYNNDTDELNKCGIRIDTVQTSGSGTRIKTGLHSRCYTQPDNGGDTSAILAVQTGGGSGISVYKLHEIRPSGYTNYQDSAQGALEVGTSDQSFAILATAGMQNYGAHTNAATACRLQIGNNESKGLVISAVSAATYSTSTAIAIGTDAVNGAVTSKKFEVTMAGDITTAGSAVFEKAAATCNVEIKRTGANAVTGILSAQADTFYVGTSTADQFVFLVGGSSVGMFDTSGRMLVGSGTPNAKAILTLTSTTLGFLPPRMTGAERDLIATPPAGLVVYNTTTNKLNVYTTAWEAVTSV
jgi:hypothetical protein